MNNKFFHSDVPRACCVEAQEASGSSYSSPRLPSEVDTVGTMWGSIKNGRQSLAMLAVIIVVSHMLGTQVSELNWQSEQLNMESLESLNLLLPHRSLAGGGDARFAGGLQSQWEGEDKYRDQAWMMT